ncbi:MAG: ASKHA domain-containing protein [Verrucomicrobiota bacterium]|jgi:uncharacterized 2Fe-2S/4Fe-4S cluster protein (DUF4445 family)
MNASACPPVRLELLPLGKVVSVEPGTSLQDVLFVQGVEFPCGGRGRCKGCRIKVLAGSLAVTEGDKQKFSAAELAEGWRLACRARAEGDLQIELAQWEAAILSDESAFAFAPQPGLGIAVDLGTTTVVAQLLDLETGQVLGVRAELNAQAKHGADIMSRVEFAVAAGGQRVLETQIRKQIGRLIRELLYGARSGAGVSPSGSGAGVPPVGAAALPSRHEPGARRLNRIVLVGNTVMHHLFCGLSLEPLSHYPFEPEQPGLRVCPAAELGWELPGNPAVHFLPCLGGFVGSDILAGVLATRLHEAESPAALIDLGTNGEIVVGNREGLLCAATAAGPAFEGARISRGMRAATGAISEVRLQSGRLCCRVLGQGEPRGLCGSGLVDAVAAGLDLGWIRPTGRLAKGDSFLLAGPVWLTQQDVRELQLAKGAIAAGLRLLLQQRGTAQGEVTRVYLAGAFGNYINYASARRIGLLGFPPEKVQAAGNTALLGAKLALFNLHEHNGAYPDLRRRVRHVSLNEDPHFQDAFVQEMGFPDKS